MSPRSKIALGIFVVFYISYGVLITVFQEKIIYLPSAQDFNSCVNFTTAEKIEFKGTRLYVKDTEKPTVVLYHGNAGSACDRSTYADIFTQAGYGYIIVEYAGYSSDIEPPSHQRIKRDVENVISFIGEKNISDITIVGESIGTGLASYHTSVLPPKKLLLISPFTDVAAIARKRFWFYPSSFLVDNAFDNVAFLQNYKNHTTIIHGDSDRIISYELGQKLYTTLTGSKEFITIPGAGHNDLFLFPQTYTAIDTFLKR